MSFGQTVRSVIPLAALVMLAQGVNAERTASSQKSFLPREGLGRLIVDHLEITTFRSSLGPRRTPGMRHFADLGMKPTRVTEQRVEFDSDEWSYAITVTERADKNGDGLEDLVVKFTDEARHGTYKAESTLLLTRYCESGDLIAIAFEP